MNPIYCWDFYRPNINKTIPLKIISQTSYKIHSYIFFFLNLMNNSCTLLSPWSFVLPMLHSICEAFHWALCWIKLFLILWLEFHKHLFHLVVIVLEWLILEMTGHLGFPCNLCFVLGLVILGIQSLVYLFRYLKMSSLTMGPHVGDNIYIFHWTEISIWSVHGASYRGSSLFEARKYAAVYWKFVYQSTYKSHDLHSVLPEKAC